jgi:molybdopterin converting factor small subunit
VGEALKALADRYPGTREQLFSPDGELNRYVNVYLNDEDVRVLDGLNTGAGEADTVVILPAMAGGQGLGVLGLNRGSRSRGARR